MRTRLRALLTASLAMALTLTAAGGTALASAGQSGGPPVGPALVSPLGHPGLCWQGEGNGSSISLEACNAAVQGQLWTFNGNGVVMNGNGYCLQNSGPVRQEPPLFLSFSGQCAGAASQTWTFSGVTNLVRNPAAGVCAYPQGGSDVPGAAIIGRPCGGARPGYRWSFGVSRLTLSGGRRTAGADGHSVTHAAGGTSAKSAGNAAGAAGAAGGTSAKSAGNAASAASTASTASAASAGNAAAAAGGTGAAAGGTAAAGPRRDFTAEVTVANAAGAMTAYGAIVSLRPPKGLTVTRLAGSGGLSGWTCTVRNLSCQGSLAGGLSGRITIGGAVSGRTPAHAITVRAAVTHTNEARRGIRPAHVPVQVYAVAASASLPGASPHGSVARSVTKFGLVIAGLLVALGIIMFVAGRRRPRAHGGRAAGVPEYPAGPAAQRFAGPAGHGDAGPATKEFTAQDPAAPDTKDTAARGTQD